MRSILVVLLVAALATSSVPAAAQALTFDRSAMPAVVPAAPAVVPRATFLPLPVPRPHLPIPHTPLVLSVPPPPHVMLRQAHGHKGQIVGALVGGGVGAIVGYLRTPTGYIRSDCALVSAFFVGIVGSAIGHVFDRF